MLLLFQQLVLILKENGSHLLHFGLINPISVLFVLTASLSFNFLKFLKLSVKVNFFLLVKECGLSFTLLL